MRAGTGPLPGGTVVGRYRIDGPLGRGGMAIVYEATHESLGRRVALKVLAAEFNSDPEFVERFRREGQMQASLEHPHIVTIYEAGESAHGLYIAMALIRGSTLAGLMLDGGVAGERALALLRQVAEALDAAAARGLVHRDVKPRNVLVGEDDHAYLADFGLTKLGGESGVTITGQLIGTLAYLAPEVIRGEPATRASDIYAFAAMVFECLSGGPVFPRATQAAQLYAHTTEPPPRISRRRAELPTALDAVLARGLAKHPSERPATAVGLIDEVAEAMSGVDLARLDPPPAPDSRADMSADTTIEPVVSVPPRRLWRARERARRRCSPRPGWSAPPSPAAWRCWRRLTKRPRAPRRALRRRWPGRSCSAAISPSRAARRTVAARRSATAPSDAPSSRRGCRARRSSCRATASCAAGRSARRAGSSR